MALSNDSQLSEDWTDIPLFAPEGAQIPDLSDASDRAPSHAVGALSHLLYDEETPEEKSELYRSEGNRLFKIGTKRYVSRELCKF